MADATSSGVFQVVDNVNGGGGGSCFVIPATAQHDIQGNFIASGAILLAPASIRWTAILRWAAAAAAVPAAAAARSASAAPM
ncbi:hypothetical protein [Mesorhizobium waimense]|uniref:hypothetical protein n=1 Tax=Mesorhizobium waimense TaxID=1300307 RepID=UPI001FE1E5A9|nr:hypothetical protein [Mesorhizobium waimense]